MSSELVLQCRGVARTFSEGGLRVEVLKRVDLDLRVAERVAIIGSSGSGKSTLLHCLGGLDRTSAGEVLIGATAIGSLGERARGRLRNEMLGFVYQFHHLLPEFTAAENIVLPQLADGTGRRAAEARAAHLLDLVGVGARAAHRPAALSGGEQQRVAFCRALANRPRLLLADEPTGNLDPETSDRVFATLLSLVRETGLSALIATHNLDLARRMDRVVRLEAGRII